MSRSACWSYVTWYNKESSGNWATWVPGEAVEPGNVGRFDEQMRFWRTKTLAAVRVASARRPGAQTLWSGGDIRFTAEADGRSALALGALGDLGGGLKITASRAHACFLHMGELRESWIANEDEVLARVANDLKNWEIDSVIVGRRLEARRGFAAISRSAGASFDASAAGGVAAIGAAEFSLQAGRSRGGFHFYEFGPGSIPVFSRAHRVKRSLWGRLLPWRHDGPSLIGPDGRRYEGPGPSPSALSGLPPEARQYDPERSAMTLAELSSIPVRDLFEVVTSVSDVTAVNEDMAGGRAEAAQAGGGVAYFPLPVPPIPAALAATDPADGAPPVVRTTTPDGLARLALFNRGSGEWLLEVSLTSGAPVPVVVPVCYSTGDGNQRELLIPVDDDGAQAASSVAELWDYAGEAWESASPVAPRGIEMWAPDVVEASVRSAVTTATVRAWEGLASVAPPHIRSLIADALKDLGSPA